MISFAHVIVWIDHRVAHLYSFNREDSDSVSIHHHGGQHRIHHRAGTMGVGHTSEDAAYLREVAEALMPAREILIVGPSLVKHALKSYIDEFVPSLAARIVGVAALDHPTEGQILNFARKYFRVADRLQPNGPYGSRLSAAVADK